MRKLTGLLYKDLYLNRFAYIAILACGIVFENLSLVMTWFGNASDGIDMSENSVILCAFDLMGAIVAFFFMQSMNKSLLSSDENKAWASFIISTPASSKYHILAKYESTLIVNFSLYVFSMIIFAAHDIICPPIASVSGLIPFFLCFNLIMFAIEAPFMFRFSTKYADAARIAPILLLFFIVIIYLLFGDISFLSGEMDSFIEAFLNILSGKRESKVLTLISTVLPFVTIIFYVTSYKISCKLYRKGVESYAK